MWRRRNVAIVSDRFSFRFPFASVFVSCPCSLLQTVYQKVYTSFVEALDGIDNGIAAYPASAGAPLYKSRTDLSSRVAKLNPEWNEEGAMATNFDERFAGAMALTGSELQQEVKFYANSWLPARHIVQQSLANRFQIHPSGQILRLDTFTLWKVSGRKKKEKTRTTTVLRKEKQGSEEQSRTRTRSDPTQEHRLIALTFLSLLLALFVCRITFSISKSRTRSPRRSSTCCTPRMELRNGRGPNHTTRAASATPTLAHTASCSLALFLCALLVFFFFSLSLGASSAFLRASSRSSPARRCLSRGAVCATMRCRP